MSDNSKTTKFMTDKPVRRDVIKLLVGSTVGLVGFSPAAKAFLQTSDSADSDDSHPPPTKTTIQPFPLSVDQLGYRQEVPAKTSIHHTYGWQTVGDESRQKLEELDTITDHEFWIDGKRVTNSNTYWNWFEIKPELHSGIDRSQWGRIWQYTTEPKPVGQHRFSAKITFSRPFTTRISANETKTWEGTHQYEGIYTVVPDSSEQPHRRKRRPRRDVPSSSTGMVTTTVNCRLQRDPDNWSDDLL